jgi:hypothetical protein
MDPRALVVQFNDCINSRNLAALTGLMTDDHVCQRVEGLLRLVPRLSKIFDTLVVVDDAVIVVGRSTGADPRLAGPRCGRQERAMESCPSGASTKTPRPIDQRCESADRLLKLSHTLQLTCAASERASEPRERPALAL